jgi:type I restriction enzyme, S subunit
MSSRAPIGHLGIAAVPLCTNQGCKSFIPGADLDSRFLYWLLKSRVDELKMLVRGNTFPEVSKSTLSTLSITYPPLPEQRRIADLLDAAMTKVESAVRIAKDQEKAISTISKSYITNLIGKLVGDHSCVQLEKLIPARDGFRDGPFGSNLKTAHYTDSGARVIRLQNIGNNGFLDEHRAYISLSHFETIRAHEAIQGDVIVAALGDGARSAGRACVLPELNTPAVVKADCFRIRPPSTMRSKFLEMGLNSSFVRTQLTSQLRGATRPRVNLEMLRKVLFPAVSIDVQDRAIDQIEALSTEVATLSSTLIVQRQALNALPASLLSSAFRGRL